MRVAVADGPGQGNAGEAAGAAPERNRDAKSSGQNEDSRMLIRTSRFGQVDVDESRLITFPKGLLGFPTHKRFVLLEPAKDGYFWWLQSVDAADVAFVVTDPSLFVSTYRVPIRPDQMEEWGMGSLEEAQVFVVVNKHGEMLTGNLQGPLVINVARRIGEQLVLSDRRYTTRVPLVELAAKVTAQSA